MNLTDTKSTETNELRNGASIEIRGTEEAKLGKDPETRHAYYREAEQEKKKLRTQLLMRTQTAFYYSSGKPCGSSAKNVRGPFFFFSELISPSAPTSRIRAGRAMLPLAEDG